MQIPRADTVSLIQSKIAEKVGPQRYKIWFKNATQLTVADGHLKVSTPNLFICGWIERNFSEMVADCARDVTGRDYNVSFVVDTKLQHAMKKRQLDSQAEYIAKNPDRVARAGGRPGPLIGSRQLKGRFDGLVVGKSNELAVSVVRRIAELQPDAYSPVFLHGGCGLGKTHLLHALGNELQNKHPQCRWVYVTGEEFTNAFVSSVRSNNIEQFRQEFRHVDVLILDDVHFMANKKATQEEFLHTFNAIEAHNKKIVLASDAHPKLIGQFSEQLINRFMAGMVVRVETPDFETRCEILKRRVAQSSKHPVPDDVIHYIAEHMESNVRELEGALLKLVMFSAVSHLPITLSLARRALSDHLQRTQRVLGLEEIDHSAATYFGLTSADLHTSRKTRTIALARGIAMYLGRKHTDLSFPEIGRFMGNKNHSTVILANRKIGKMIEADEWVTRQTPAGERKERLRDIIEKIEKELGKHAPATKAGALDGPAPAPSASGDVTDPAVDTSPAPTSPVGTSAAE